MNILLLGKNGQVGWELQRSLALLGTVTALDFDSTEHCGDFAQPNAIADTVRALRPDVIVNAAAHTAVDRAETEPDLARLLNATTPGVLAVEAARLGALLVHYSTDYVFDGSGHQPWVETDAPAPLSVYGRTKLEGEQLIAQSGAQHLILRTSWVFAARGGNFAKTMLRLAQHKDSLRVVADQWGAPTSAHLIARATLDMMRVCDSNEQSLWGTYHVSASGRTNWHAYACEAIAQAKRLGLVTKLVSEAIEAIPASAYPTPACRPANSCLNTAKLATVLGYPLADWHNGVQDTIQELAASGWTHL